MIRLTVMLLHPNERGKMGERRKARRYEVYLPVQVCLARRRPADFHTGQLRDVSRSGIFFHSHVELEPGTHVELTFSLPGEKERGTTVLVRASAKALRVNSLPGEISPLYGVAATIDRLDFVRPVVSSAA
jgi:PilZ domain-containing protein